MATVRVSGVLVMDVPTGPKLAAQAQQSLRMKAQRQGHCSQVEDGLEGMFSVK
jgi:hypothetical protein